tara:strand:- start:233 stop:538 length:306 start_codon:yes stop_codon:yes gene_type:complete
MMIEREFKMIERFIRAVQSLVLSITLFCLLIHLFIDPYSVFQNVSVFFDSSNREFTGNIIRRGKAFAFSGWEVLSFLIVINALTFALNYIITGRKNILPWK